MYVASLCFKCFRWFIRLFQVFHLDVAYIAMAIHICCKCSNYMDVAKVDLNVTYVAMAIHACFKHMFQVFHLF
jgi:hypothetical protein